MIWKSTPRSAAIRTLVAVVTVTLITPMFGQAGAWTSPVALSTGGQGWEAAAAIDGNGNSVALWDERTTLDQLWSRSKPGAGNWGSVTQVSPALQTTSVFPAVRISTAGLATAVWSDQGGVWTADRPPASNWNPAQLLIPGVSTPIFVMNSRGDAAIVWTVGGAEELQRVGNGCSTACRAGVDGATDSRQWRACRRRSCRNLRERCGDCDLGIVQRSLHQEILCTE